MPSRFDQSKKPVALARLNKKLAHTLWLVVYPGRLVDRNVCVEQHKLATVLAGIALLDAGLALAKRFHLASPKDDPGLDAFLDFVFVPRAPVLGHAPG